MPQTDFILDKYIMVTAGQPYRLLPFGRIYRSGRIREITPEVAATFKLPHFKPPIKLGSHEDTTPAGGFIVGLEVREDGLYAITEMNPEGITSLDKGAYRYHSPEIIWDDGGIEDATNGNIIPGPIIMGDALLHDPALGEAVALYTYQYKELTTMADETVQVPASFFDRFLSLLKPVKEEKTPEPEPQMPDEPQVDHMAVIVQERDQLKAEIDALKAEKHHAELLEAIHKEFDTEEFGASYQKLSEGEDTITMLSGMTEEQRAWVLRNFKSLSAQIQPAKLEEEIGNDIPTPEGREGLDKVINDYAVTHKVSYDVALTAIRKEQPDLFK